MKIRSGFVSNSSSSSFLIYGIYIDRNDLCGMFELHSDDVYDIDFPKGLEFHLVDDDSVYIGVSWDEVGDDETGKAFKERVQVAIKDFLPDPEVQCTTHSHAWYNG